MERKTVQLYIFVRPSEFSEPDSAIGTGSYKLLSAFTKLYIYLMSKFDKPTFGNRWNNSKTAPISLYFVPTLGKDASALFLTRQTPT